MNKKVLYYIAALLWGAPGVVIAVKGIQAYLTMPTERPDAHPRGLPVHIQILYSLT